MLGDGLWVGGRINLTEPELSFAPNAVNRSIQTGSMDLRIPLAEKIRAAIESARR